MAHLLTWILYWIGLVAFVLTIYVLTVNGTLYCAALYIGHQWAILKEEIARPLRIIREALSRKDRNSKFWDNEEDHENFYHK